MQCVHIQYGTRISSGVSLNQNMDTSNSLGASRILCAKRWTTEYDVFICSFICTSLLSWQVVERTESWIEHLAQCLQVDMQSEFRFQLVRQQTEWIDITASVDTTSVQTQTRALGQRRPPPRQIRFTRIRTLDPNDFQNLMGTSLSKYTSLRKISWKCDQFF